MSSYLDVSSNDELSHKALSGSPETLCGHLVTDVQRHPLRDPLSLTNLPCDICATLSGGGAFLKENSKQVESYNEDCPYCYGGVDETGDTCWNCGGDGTVEDPYSDLNWGPDDTLKGTKVARDEDGNTEKAGEWSEETPGKPVGKSNLLKPMGLNTDANPATPPNKNEFATAKVATNWTRDGYPIEDGFNVIISKDEANRIPFLDLSKVSISERIACPDCREDHWLQNTASCENCNTLKCKNCMTAIDSSKVFGRCLKCAAADDTGVFDTYEDSFPDQDRYFSYQMQQDDDSDVDFLFMPYSEG